MRSAIQDVDVASVASTYDCLALEQLDLRLFPVPQRYLAYTPYLDGVSANWVRAQGAAVSDCGLVRNRRPATMD